MNNYDEAIKAREEALKLSKRPVKRHKDQLEAIRKERLIKI